jgi:hypothetical protein
MRIESKLSHSITLSHAMTLCTKQSQFPIYFPLINKMFEQDLQDYKDKQDFYGSVMSIFELLSSYCFFFHFLIEEIH